jgi:hypothetical protein
MKMLLSRSGTATAMYILVLAFRYSRNDFSTTHTANTEELVCEKPLEFFF